MSSIQAMAFMHTLDDILDDRFHGCAFAAFVEEAAIWGGVPPQESTRQRAYRYYEDALANRLVDEVRNVAD